MEIPSSFGELLRWRAQRLDLVSSTGAADAARLAEYLGSRKIDCSKRSIESYFNGERAPRIGKMELIMDALDVHGDDRLLAYRLAARVERDGAADTSTHGTSEADVAFEDRPTVTT